MRERIKRVKLWGGFFHLFTVVTLVLGLLWFCPKSSFRQNMENGAREEATTLDRQRLMEALDKLVRYEEYYRELHGRYTRDLSRLFLPEKLSNGTWGDVRRRYELSVLDLSPNRLLLLAIGVDHPDRATMDERHRFTANFVSPPVAKSYLYEEADRMMRLSRAGRRPINSTCANYWRLEEATDSSGEFWYAVGLKDPVLGEKREDPINGSRGVASIFSEVGEQVKRRLGTDPDLKKGKNGEVEFGVDDVEDFLRAAREAEHIYKREQGHFARRWEDLESVTGYHFLAKQAKASNIRVEPIAVAARDTNFQVTLEGTKGNLLGEQFVMDENGNMREFRYTDTLVHQLQESTKILNKLRFQISADPADEDSPELDRQKLSPVKLSD